jgi:hypothetical protein
MFLRLDTSIRNWVFIPITIITIAVNLLIKYLTILANQKKKDGRQSTAQHEDAEDNFIKTEMSSRDPDIIIKSAVARSAKLRANYMHISDRGFKSRKAFFINSNDGFFRKKFENKAPDLMNPNMMTDMLKKSGVSGLYYIIIFVGVGYFFSGFILLKLPFGLTQKFRSMLQQGLNLPDVDVSYVSAISWCLLLIFGLNSIVQHFDGGENYNMMKEQEQMMKGPMMGAFGQQGNEFEKRLNDEKDNIEIIPHYSLLDDSIDRLVDRYSYLLKKD